MARQIGTLGNIDTITVGGRVFTDTANIIILAGTAPTSTLRNCGLSKQGGSSGAYPVTTGKTYTANAALIIGITAANAAADIGQSDNSLVVSGDASSPTNPIYFITNSSTPAQGLTTAAAVGATLSLPLGGKIASTKFGFFTTNGSGSAGATCLLFGYEA